MRLIIYILAFIFIYNVPFTNIPISGSKIAVLCLLCIIIFKSAKGYKIKVKNSEIVVLELALFLTFYSIIIMLVNRSGDINIVYSCILLIFNHMLGAFLFTQVLKSNKMLTIENVMKILIVITTVQSVIILLMMLSQNFYNLISNLAYLPTRESLYLRYGGARGYGLAASITYDLGVVQSFSLLYLSYFIQIKRRIVHVILYILIVVSVLATGRTGLIGIILSIMYMLISDLKSQRKGMRTLVGIFLILVCAGVYLMSSSDNSVISSMQEYIFEAFNNYKETGEFSTATGSNIAKMFDSMTNYSLKTWIFGDGRYQGEGLYYYGNVDVGFLRHILYFGLAGSALLLLYYLNIFKRGLKLVKNNQIKIIWVLLFLYLIIAHIKGDFLLGCGMGISTILILFYTFVEEKTLDYEKSTNC